MAAVAAAHGPHGMTSSSSNNGNIHSAPTTTRTTSGRRQQGEAPMASNSIVLPTQTPIASAEAESATSDKPRARKLSLPARIRRRDSLKRLPFVGGDKSTDQDVEPVPSMPLLPSGLVVPSSSSTMTLASLARNEIGNDYRGPVTNDNAYMQSPKMHSRRSIFRKREKAPPLPTSASLPVLPPSLALPADLSPNDPSSSRLFGSSPIVSTTSDSLVGTGESSKQGLENESKAQLGKSHEEEVLQIASARKRQEAHRDARLSTKEASYLFEWCAREIKMRGLAILGIFRPFRLAESPREIERLIELFLLRCDPQRYGTIFLVDPSIMSSFFEEALGKKDPETEFKRKLAYANIHDVVALFKWGLRRVNLQPSDMGDTGDEALAWYEEFVDKETAKGYPIRAFSEILLPSMTRYTVKIFKTVLDLMSTISAHHVANSMPAWRICRIIGYWLVGRIASEKATTDLKTALARFRNAGLIMEHLLLVYIREQSADSHYMPLRLTELVSGYALSNLRQDRYPGLPADFQAPASKALCVESNTFNIIRTPKQPRRTPREILDASLQARAASIESSEDVDDWIAICDALGAKSAGSKSAETHESHTSEYGDTVDSELPSSQLSQPTEEKLKGLEDKLVKEEDLRILSLVATELSQRRDIFESSEANKTPNNADLADADSNKPLMPRSKSYSTHETSISNNSLKPSESARALNSLPQAENGHSRSRTNLGVLPEDENEKSQSVDWSSFKNSGFATSTPQVNDLHLDESLRPRSELERAFDEGDRQRPNGKRVRGRSGSFRRSRAASSTDTGSLKTTIKLRGPPRFVLKSVKTIDFDETFAMVWLDQILDDCPAARLPNIVCVQLSTKISSKLLGSSAGQGTSKNTWLLLAETIVPPMPPPPPTPRHSDWKSMRRASFRGLSSDPLSLFSSRETLVDDDDRISLASVRSSVSTRIRESRGMAMMRGWFLRGEATTRKDDAEDGEQRHKRSSTHGGVENGTTSGSGGRLARLRSGSRGSKQPTPVESQKSSSGAGAHSNGQSPISPIPSSSPSSNVHGSALAHATAGLRGSGNGQHENLSEVPQRKSANGNGKQAKKALTVQIPESNGVAVSRPQSRPLVVPESEVPRQCNGSSNSKQAGRLTPNSHSLLGSSVDVSTSNHSHSERILSSTSSTTTRYLDAREGQSQNHCS